MQGHCRSAKLRRAKFRDRGVEMQGCLRRFVLVGSSVALALGVSSAAAAMASASAPKLQVTKVTLQDLPGKPPYIVLDESSRASGFVVWVSVRNFGGSKSGKSVVALALEEKGKRKWFDDQFINPMPPNKPRSKPKLVKFVVDNLQADPGFLTATATVKWATSATHTSTDSDSAKPVAVIARDWNISYFHTKVNENGVGPSTDTYAEGKLMYRFSRLDESAREFVYKAYGQITNMASYSAGTCSGRATASMTQNPWPGTESELTIKSSLTSYSAGVVTKSQPPLTFTAMCAGTGFGIPVQLGWENLETFTGGNAPPSMTPDQTTLTDEASKQTPVGVVKFLWAFNARLSGA